MLTLAFEILVGKDLKLSQNSKNELIKTLSACAGHAGLAGGQYYDLTFENKNILTGDFRKIDLFSKPFNFQKNYLLSIEDKDSLNLANHKYLYLFSKEQIKRFLKLNN